jgi:hypothetical protein
VAYSIPEIVTTLNSLPAEAKQATLDSIAAAFGPLEAPPKPEPTPEDLEKARLDKVLAEERAKAEVENQRRRSETAHKEIMGALNTLGSDDLKIAMSAIAANCGVPVAAISNIPANETKEDLESLPTTELRLRAEARGIKGYASMNDKELIAAILKVSVGTPPLGTVATEPRLETLSRLDLIERAKELHISGAGSMNKDELIEAIEEAQG